MLSCSLVVFFFYTFASMRIIVVLILLAFGCQQTTVNGQQTSCTVPESVEGTTLGASTSSATAYTRTVDCCPLTVDFYESQIRKADSLYKNYLPQSNFEEVKAAMEFFDSLRLTTDNSQQTTDIFHRIFPNKRQRTICTVPEPVEGTISGASTSSATAYPRTVDCCPLSVDFICAKAHYYHAVGLTEKVDIVGACEHYLIALEIMEEMMANGKSLKAKGKKSVDNPEDYEKIRCVALIYTRLGEIFLNESSCGLSIVNYKNALSFSNVLDDNMFKSNTMKYIGNAYQLYSKQDSALLYYRKSLEYNNSIANKLDIEKCIAQILYYNGERDSALIMLKNNLNKIDNEIVKYAYHHTLGNMFYIDKVYDSALCYLEKYLDDSIITKKLAFTTTLSAIYDSIGDYEKKAYYDNLSSKLFFNNINKEVDKSQLQVLYNKYNERKTEKENAIAKARTRRNTITISFVVIVVVISALTYIRYNHRKLHDELKNEIDNRTKDLESKNSIISQKEKLINEYQITNDNKDKIIDKQKKEIDRIKTRINKKGRSDIEAYYTSNVCKKILSRKDNDFSCLKEDELALLLEAADKHLDNISYRLQNSFPELNKKDIYTICLIILNLEKKLPVLLGRNTKTIWDRLHKLKKLMNVESNSDLFLYIKNNFID